MFTPRYARRQIWRLVIPSEAERSRGISYYYPIWYSTFRDVSTPLDMTTKKSQRTQMSPVISNRERRANIQGALSGRHFIRCLRLFEKMNPHFVLVVIQKIWRLLKTHSA